MQDNTYLGTEKVGKLLEKFAIPCIFSLIISCLYSIVDQIFVGNMIGYLGNAATGVIFPITVVGWGASLLFGDGAAAALSVCLGRNDTKSIHRSVGNSVLFSFISGVLIIAFTCLQKVCSIFLQSIGYAKKAAPLSVLRDVFLIIASLIAPVFFGVTGIFGAAPIADVLAILITAVVMVGTWKHLCEEEKKENAGSNEVPAAIQKSTPGAIIAISREHGTAGKYIGQLVAQKNGYSVLL